MVVKAKGVRKDVILRTIARPLDDLIPKFTFSTNVGANGSKKPRFLRGKFR